MLELGATRRIELAGTVGQAALPGTCGELFQGLLDGEPCLVSCPIDRLAEAHVTVQPERAQWRSPQRVPKTLRALQLAAQQHGLPPGGRVEIDTALPSGRGYGASTADLGAALAALGRAVEAELSPQQAAALAAQVEPSDSTLFPGLALFDHRAGRLLADLGAAPPLAVLALDPGGGVDTVAYNAEVTPAVLRPFAPLYRTIFSLLQTGLRERDWAKVGAGATLSAQTHQVLLDNPWLDPALDLCRRLGGVGVCRAHSGTILGVLLDPARTDPAEALRRARLALPEVVGVRLYHLVGGGAR